MEVVDDVAVFPTEVQEVKVVDQQQKSQIISLEQKETANDTEISDKINSGQEKNSDEVENLKNKETNPNSNVTEPPKDEDFHENIEPNMNSDELSNKQAEFVDELLKTESKTEERVLRTAPPSQPANNLMPIIKKRQKAITKPTTTNINKRTKTISSLSIQRSIPESILNNPYVKKKFGVYKVEEIVAKPPRAALDPKSYHPKAPVELGELAQSILDGRNLKRNEEIPHEELKIAANQLKQLELELIDQTDYMEAKRAAAAFDYMEMYLGRQKSINQLKENLEGIISKKNELLAYVNSLNNDIEVQLDENKMNFDMKLKELEFQHTQEIQQFDNEVPTELTKEFRHETNDYLELRVKQRSLAMQRDFDAAQKIKEKADKIELSQIKGDLKKMKKYYKRKRNKILRKHRLQIQCLMDGFNLREREIRQSRKFEIDAANGRIAAIDAEVKLKCEDKGIKMSDLNLRCVDEQRVDELIARSNETRYAKFRSRSAASNLSTNRKPLPPLPEA
ncbi:hypothetical protein TRFO_26153 [Tritrichomonas foetus]|uniref:Uncharacterized protein n=1 Tax=Tritrichomonas foetus TaxID=1144522 RepID=A0A1J4K927_9EUKA|nr:hypothetical protein TRFO_26153 [Tritrichomonas foetus]|eukprot:OHT05941.1 hypothetical protein TRFO_26153 [Tritrichomonas foetus]